MTPSAFSVAQSATPHPALYQYLVETAQDMIWSIDIEGRYTFVNSAVRQILGYAPEEMMGRQFTDFQPPEQIEQARAAIARLQAGEPFLRYETQQIHKNGQAIDLLTNAVLMRDEAGNILGTTGTASDITERKQIEAALRQSEERFQKLTANVPGVIYQLHLRPDGTYCFPYVSAYSQQLWEIELDVIQGDLDIARQVHPDDLESFHQAMARSTQTLEDFDWIGRIRTPSGKLKWLHIHSRPELQVDGSIVWDGLIMDVSDRKAADEALRESEARLRQQTLDLKQTLSKLKRTQAQLIHSEKMSSLGQLVAGVAHEINNPINFIYGNLRHTETYLQDLLNLVEVYQQHYPNPPNAVQSLIHDIDLDFLSSDAQKMLQSMSAGAERIRQIVVSLRTFSHLDESEIKAVDLHAGVESTLMILQSRLDAFKIEVVRDYGHLPPVECYSADINQVFMHVLVNAIDALEETAIKTSSTDLKITVKTEVLDNFQVRVSIADNGIGIPPEHLTRLFDPFYTTKKIGKGTGLGLSISYQIITKQHNGALYCISAPDQGAEFVIEIPIGMG